ncbi:ParB-like chromosome segregation protein Spo0J [Kibdelosporangium banguiense]|uniref:ParB-like chromosome segregation protein Spo0J n=1 Tax=Kibdelosporangium banguiense TaxID=1365924 RepID=A0ABS4TLS6_9PSEU|nr:ParB N-terminal domain-containing protein [Kibdelosporangium banguiense]MBP2325350.1 ParB-like chromosome segregation protein Spo0J [Kibdelosporangium banguiense]
MAKVLSQQYRTVRLDEIQPHPDNPNRGDVGAIGESIEENGFFGALLVQHSSGHIIGGEHRYHAAREKGLTELPALVLDVDDDRARRILLVDNRSAQRAAWDDERLLAVLEELATAPAGVAGTGFTATELEDLAGVMADRPTLEELAAKHGEPNDALMLPEIRLKVSAELFDRWRAALDRYEGKDDVEKLDRLLDTVAVDP